LDADVVHQTAVVQDVPAKTGADLPDHASGFEQVAELFGLDPNCSQHGEVRVQVADGDANPSALSRNETLGTANIGTAAHQVGRHTGHHFARRDRYSACSENALQVPGRYPQ
jgi:hypothetical protein